MAPASIGAARMDASRNRRNANPYEAKREPLLWLLAPFILFAMIVEDKIVLELKAIKTMGVSEFRQLMTYLTLMDKRLGLLINFGAADFSFGDIKNSGITLDKGLYRIIN